MQLGQFGLGRVGVIGRRRMQNIQTMRLFGSGEIRVARERRDGNEGRETDGGKKELFHREFLGGMAGWRVFSGN
jgi:hypothetical protein